MIRGPQLDRTMPTREFLLRLECSYEGANNDVRELRVWKQDDGEWRRFDLDNLTPGFDIFCYALLACQHTYLRLNCAESGLSLQRVEGEMHLSTSADWDILSLLLSFSAHLRSGDPEPEVVEYIIDRMQQCPVSKSLHPIADCNVLLAFVER